MTDETIKTIFSVAMSNIDGDVKKLQAEYESRHNSLQERSKYIQELLPLMSGALTDIIQRCKQVPLEVMSQTYEKELVSFMQNLLRLQQSANDELLKTRGSLIAFENISQIYANSYSRFDTELSRAKDIQEKQSLGELESARKVGERPVKIKDIRNYAEKYDK